MGEQHGWFQGLEVENTQFHGMPTVFFSRMRTLMNCYETKTLPVPAAVRHIFMAPMNQRFFANAGWKYLTTISQHYLHQGYMVTWELTGEQGRNNYTTDMRRLFPQTFCALIALEIPEHELGAYAVKVIPTHCFDDKLNEGGVSVIPSGQFELTGYYNSIGDHVDAYTPWSVYEADQDGERRL